LIASLVAELAPVIAPVVTCAIIGVGWARLKRPYDIRFIANLVHNCGVPCLIFSALTRVDLSADAFVDMAWASLLAHVAFAVIGAAVLSALRVPLRIYLNPLIYPNVANVGLPLCLFAFGESGLALGVAYFAVDAVMVVSFGAWIASGRLGLRDIARSPHIYAALCGAAFVATGTAPPEWIANTTRLLGGLAIPLLLVTLGVSLATLRVVHLRPAFWMSLFRLGMGFTVSVAVASLLGLEGAQRGVVIINGSLSVGVINYLFAQYYGNGPMEVAAMVVVSAVLSFATLPFLLAFVL
jgi:predicted permease